MNVDYRLSWIFSENRLKLSRFMLPTVALRRRHCWRTGCTAGKRTLSFARNCNEHLVVKQTLGNSPHVRQRDRIDQTVALVDIVDAKFVNLHLHELARDLARRVE